MNKYYSENELREMGFCTYGKNILISRNAVIYDADKISLGNNILIEDFCVLSGSITLGSYIHISPFCGLYGGAPGIKMDDFSGLSSRCMIYAISDDYSGIALTNPTIPDKFRKMINGKVTINKHAILGMGVSVMPNVTIGEGSSIGSMSLVNKSVDEWGIYVGIPCKFLKERKKDLLNLEREFLKKGLNVDENM